MYKQEKRFRSAVVEVCNKLGCEVPCLRRNDDYVWAAWAMVRYGVSIIEYNMEARGSIGNHWSRAFLIGFILHELGHIIEEYVIDKRSYIQFVRNEYLAETFALSMLKKYYPKYYKPYIGTMKSSMDFYKNHFPEHYVAFSSIKEYCI